MAELERCYHSSMDRLLNEIARLYDEIVNDTEGKVLVSHLYQYNRYYELLNKINTELRRLGLQEKHFFQTQLEKVYVENQVIIGTSFSLSSEINYDQVERAINQI